MGDRLGPGHNPSSFTFKVALVRQLVAVREDLALNETTTADSGEFMITCGAPHPI
jgi:hypothetical protein